MTLSRYPTAYLLSVTKVLVNFLQRRIMVSIFEGSSVRNLGQSSFTSTGPTSASLMVTSSLRRAAPSGKSRCFSPTLLAADTSCWGTRLFYWRENKVNRERWMARRAWLPRLTEQCGEFFHFCHADARLLVDDETSQALHHRLQLAFSRTDCVRERLVT